MGKSSFLKSPDALRGSVLITLKEVYSNLKFGISVTNKFSEICVIYPSVRPDFSVWVEELISFRIRNCSSETNVFIRKESTMQVRKITTPLTEVEVPEHRYTDEQLRRECDYIRAEIMTKKLLDAGLISDDEYNQIMKENRRSFSPYLAEIL